MYYDMYHAFGVPNDRHVPLVNYDPTEEEIPKSELHDTIAHIEVTDHGDSPGMRFVSVMGTDEEKAVTCWKRVVASLPDYKEWWVE